jgi:hypothetical protein
MQEAKRRHACEVHEALAFLEPHVHRKWLIPQFRHHIGGERENGYRREGQQQVLRPTFEGIRDSVRELIGKQMDALARQFAANHDMKVKEELERLAGEYGKLRGGCGGSCRSEGASSCHCASSLDYLIRSCQHIRRNRQADLLCRFQINDELKLLRLLHG